MKGRSYHVLYPGGYNFVRLAFAKPDKL